MGSGRLEMGATWPSGHQALGKKHCPATGETPAPASVSAHLIAVLELITIPSPPRSVWENLGKSLPNYCYKDRNRSRNQLPKIYYLLFQATI